MAIKRASPGDPLRIPAGAWNRIATATEAVERGRQAPRAFAPRDSSRVIVTNGADAVDPGGVVAMSLTPTTPDQSEEALRQRPQLAAAEPSAWSEFGRFGVSEAGMQAGDAGMVRVLGVVAVQVDVVDTDHRYADIIVDDRAKLRSYGMGMARLITAPTATGVQWCLVHLLGDIGRQAFLGKVTGSSGGTNNVWSYTVAPQTNIPGLTLSGVLNVAEKGNSGSGVEGNQFDYDNDAEDGASPSLRAVANDTPVWVDWQLDTTSGPQAWINVANGITGVCA